MVSHTWAKPRKKRCSAVKPSMFGAGPASLQRFLKAVGDVQAAQVRDVLARVSSPLTCRSSTGDRMRCTGRRCLGSSLNGFASSGVHQSRRLPLGVELAALVVEAVRHLVADHRADRPVVDGVVGLWSKNGGCRMPAGKTISLSCGS